VIGVPGTGDVEVGQRRPDTGVVVGLPVEGADRGSRRTLEEQDLLVGTGGPIAALEQVLQRARPYPR
jgi:hypothetical protein